ncbi:MAG: ATP-binding protein [Microbacterium sp.]
MSSSLRDTVAAADADRFVGRGEQLRAFDELLAAGTAHRVLFVHGAGGVGKSALLRAMQRRCAHRGLPAVAIDGRSPVETVFAAIAAAAQAPVVVFIDEADALGAALPAVRDRLLDDLASTSRVVLAGRHRPDPSWRENGLDVILREAAVPPLAEDDADRLLALRGVAPDRRPEILRFAQGSPLALTVASAPAATGPGAGAGSAASAPAALGSGELEERLTAWLTGRERLDTDAELIEVAAIAPLVDARLLAAALPGRPTREAIATLAGLAVTERVGGRVALHGVLAAAVRARLRESAPGSTPTPNPSDPTPTPTGPTPTPSDSTPGGATPGGSTPGGATPGGSTPSSSTPATAGSGSASSPLSATGGVIPWAVLTGGLLVLAAGAVPIGRRRARR